LPILATGSGEHCYLTYYQYLSRAPAQFGRSFLLTETDDNDLTYFIPCQLEAVLRGRADSDPVRFAAPSQAQEAGPTAGHPPPRS
jgi:hypothetical protein